MLGLNGTVCARLWLQKDSLTLTKTIYDFNFHPNPVSPTFVDHMKYSKQLRYFGDEYLHNYCLQVPMVCESHTQPEACKTIIGELKYLYAVYMEFMIFTFQWKYTVIAISFCLIVIIDLKSYPIYCLMNLTLLMLAEVICVDQRYKRRYILINKVIVVELIVGDFDKIIARWDWIGSG